MVPARIAPALLCIVAACTATPPDDDPTPDEPIAAVDLEVDVDAGDLNLEGILSLPERGADEQVPAIVLVHGSGPQNRDETLPINFPGAPGLDAVDVFSDLAEALQGAGWAVLRYDKRTCGTFNDLCDNEYPVPALDLLVSDFLADAEAALDWLGARDEVDSEALVLAGHSQGATFAPTVASERDDIVAGVMLAGEYRPIDEIIAFQVDLQGTLLADAGLTPAQIAERIGPLAELIDDLAAIRAGTYDGEMADETQAFWLEWMQMTDAAPDIARGVDVPLFAISGEYDWNIPPVETEAWGTLFDEEDPNPGHAAVVLPCLTHALNCVAEPDWLAVTADDVETFVSPDLIGELLDFLSGVVD
jgi:uncharacterized protein